MLGIASGGIVCADGGISILSINRSLYLCMLLTYFQLILAFIPLILECYFLIVLTFDDQNYVVRILLHLLLDPLH